MNLILKNPYRIIGLLAGVKAAEQIKHINRLKMYLDAEQEPQNDFSFPKLGIIQRNVEVVSEAASKLNLDLDKMNAALFWFYKGNPITDEPAFDAIKEGNIEDAISIWSKLTNNKEVDSRNASAFQNLSTILFAISSTAKKDETLFEKGLEHKLKFLESEHFHSFKALTTDETFKTTKIDVQLSFLNAIHTELEKNGGITSDKFIEIISKQNFSAKDLFIKELIQKPINKIEQKIEQARKSSNENKSKAGEIGNKLYEETYEELSLLKKILGISHIKYISIADKLAGEILQCGITLFNHFFETETEVGEITLELVQKSKSVAIGRLIIERINDNEPVIIKYVNDRPIREKTNIVRSEVEFIYQRIEKFQNESDSIVNAINFANECSPKLNTIKMKLSSLDELYISLSTSVASNSSGMIVSTVNEAMRKRTAYVDYLNGRTISIPSIRAGNLFFDSDQSPFAPPYSLENLKYVITEAWSATLRLESFDMDSKQRTNFIKNKESLKGIYKQLNEGIVFVGDTPVPKWVFWVIGIIVLIILVSTCE